MKLVIAVVLLAGCWGTTAPSKPVPVTAGPAASVTDLVRVIATGAGPRKRLRYQLHPNTAERMELDMTMKTTTHMDDSMLGARDTTSEVPTMRSRMRIDIGAIDSTGAAGVGFVYEDCRIAPEAKVADAMRGQLDAVLGKFVGMHGTAKLTARGSTENLVFQPPDNADPMVVRSLDQMKDQMKNFYVALPDEPVGIGAEWEITQINALMGASLTTVLHYKLVAFEGNTVSCDVEITQTAANQKLDINGMPGMLDSLKSSGHGHIRFPLQGLIPVGELGMDTTFSFSVGADDARTAARTTIHVDIATRPVK